VTVPTVGHALGRQYRTSSPYRRSQRELASATGAAPAVRARATGTASESATRFL